MSGHHECSTHLMHHPEGKKHLPQPRGPHSVGFLDLMTPGDPEKGSLLRIYYPTNEQCLEKHDQWPIWAEDKYTAGLLTFMKAVLHRWPSWAPRNEYAYMDVVKLAIPFLPTFGFPSLFKWAIGNVHIPIIRNAEPISGKTWPLVVFSHGMGCARFTYSQICYDLASQGFIVAAPEHRDGSGCLSFYNEGSSRQWVQHRRVELAEDEYKVRNSQVHQRSAEVARTLDIMAAINRGDYVENILRPEEVGTVMDLNKLKATIDLSRTILAGHSFGGATTLLTLSKDPRFKIGLVLDGWLFPIRDEDVAADVQQPVLFINTESFLHNDNLSKMSTFSEAAADGGERTCVCIKGSVHQNHLDVPFVVQRSILKRTLGVQSSTCPEIVMDLTNKLMIRFIRSHLNLPEDLEINAEIEKQNKILQPGFASKVVQD